MSISTTTNRVSYNGDGVTTVFPYAFLILANTDLEVIETVIATGVETVKTLTTHYTVSGAGTGSGNVTMLTAPASGVRLTIRRVMPRTQLVDYVENDSFPAETHEQALDKLTMIVQELDTTVSRSLRQPKGDSADVGYLPAKVTRASKYLAFDVDGNPIASEGTNGVAASSFMATVLDDTSANAARATLSAMRNPCVVMIRDSINTWSVYDETGALMDVSASTSQGLQEAINRAKSAGANLEVIGGMTTASADWGLITSTATITWPAMRNTLISFKGVHLTLNTGAADGMVFNSAMMVQLDWIGEIVYSGTGSAVRFQPTTAVPVDPVTAIIDSRFNLNTVVNTNTVGSLSTVQFDPGAGSITHNEFHFIEINGDGDAGGVALTTFGFYVATPGVGFGFTDNFISCPHVHGHKNASVQVCPNTTRATQSARNRWDVNCVPRGATSDGFNTFGVKDYGIVNVLNAIVTPVNGCVFQSSATKNRFISTELAATTEVNDVSTTKDNFVNGMIEGLWTPVLTFDTPGNVAVAYSTQYGRYQRTGNMVTITFNIITSSFTHTTASGNLKITGLPYTSRGTAGNIVMGALRWVGITVANPDINAFLPNGANFVNLGSSVSGGGGATITTAHVPTGGSVTLIGSLTYFVA